ncbi:hypothetical protein AVEN_30099-1, partial [Araneus ventricosus]
MKPLPEEEELGVIDRAEKEPTSEEDFHWLETAMR